MVQELIPELPNHSPGETESENVPSLQTVIRLGNETTPGMYNFDALLADALETATDQERAHLRELGGRLDHHEPINIQFTSGTTGSPKGATLSHHNVLNNARICGQILSATLDDRICVPVPMYHCFGMVGGALVSLTSGATMVLPSESFEPGATLRAIESEGCTIVYGVPTMYIAMLGHPDFDQTNVTTLRTRIMAGAPCPEELMKQLVDQFHLGGITIAYGMTETSPVSFQEFP